MDVMQKDPVFNNHLTFVLTKTSEGNNKVFFYVILKVMLVVKLMHHSLNAAYSLSILDSHTFNFHFG